jgi:FkbM family methyltransferase
MDTKWKVFLATVAYTGLTGFRKLLGRDSKVLARRGGINWDLDISEGIDFSICVLGGFERETVKAYATLLQGTKNAVVIDIGANCASHSLPLARMVSSQEHARVYALEAAEFAYARLVRNLALNAALSGVRNPRQILIWNGSDSDVPSSTYARWPLSRNIDDSELHSVHRGALHHCRGSEIMTLDQFIESEGLTSVDLLKIDVDGYEVQVLQGAFQTLSKLHPTLVLEWAPHLIDNFEDSSLEGIVLELISLGYSVYLVESGRLDKYDIESLKKRVPAGGSVNVVLKWSDPFSGSEPRD